MTPPELAAAARALVSRPSEATAGWWSRAAVLLARQALEARLGELVSRQGGDPSRAPFTSQLLVLPELIGDREQAARVAWVWAALSRAAHHPELPATAVEVARWVEVVEGFVGASETGP